jgi:hypothetical protein
MASCIASEHFYTALQKSEALRNLIASYNEVLLAQVQQTAACNALHAMECRLARWLLRRGIASIVMIAASGPAPAAVSQVVPPLRGSGILRAKYLCR